MLRKKIFDIPVGYPRARWDKQALKVLRERYLWKNGKGQILETPDGMLYRVAKEIASAEKKFGLDRKQLEILTKKFYLFMRNHYFLPNSPTLMNAGKGNNLQYSACFVLPIEDSMESIFIALKNAALIHKSGGGTGFSFSRLRPKGSFVGATGGVASGPVSFMRIFDAATGEIKQGGCVSPDTRIATEFGLVKIKNLGPKNKTRPNTWYPHNGRAFTVATDKGVEISDEFYNNGVAKVKRIKTACGYSISTTLEHRLRVIDEDGSYVWKYMKEIKPGDWVALQKDTYFVKGKYLLPKCNFKIHINAKKIKIPSIATPKLGEFIGFFIGDGVMSLSQRGRGRLIFTINGDDKELGDYLIKTSKELFDIRPILGKKKEDKGINYFLNSTVLVYWLKQIGVEKKSAGEADVPEIVFRAGRDFAYGFLKGLFGADGFVSDEGYISLSSVSEKLITNTQLLLLSLGIPSKISFSKNRRGAFGGKPLYRLSIITKAGVEIFKKKIGFILERKNGRLKNFKEEVWEFNDIIPNQQRLFEEIYNGLGRGCGKGKNKKGADRILCREVKRYLPDIAASGNLARSRLEHLVKKHIKIRNHPVVQWLVNNKQFYDKVTSIEQGKSLTMDLSVPRGNTYIANGFVSHNTRRGANMGILRVDHPDILEFIDCKNSGGITNFNISVAVTDEFIEAAKKGKNYWLRAVKGWPDGEGNNGRYKGGERLKKLSAAMVLEKIVESAWRTGDPGVLFLDKVNQSPANPVPEMGPVEATNPCGEQPLYPNEACNLGSINLAKMVKRGKINEKKLEKVVKLAVRFLDDVIDVNPFPVEEIDKNAKINRRIGLGVMGWADMLFKLGIPYDSQEALILAEKVMKFINKKGHQASQELAKTRGPFPNFKKSIYKNGPPMRNATVTTIAPTGSISILAGASSGIEPIFALAFTHKTDVRTLKFINPIFKKAVRLYKNKKEILAWVQEHGSLSGAKQVPKKLKAVFKTAHEISWQWHIKMQAAFQKYTDNAVSKTINMPNSATAEEVKKAYLMAYEAGCKGITVFRDGCKGEQVLHLGTKKEEKPLAVEKQPIKARPTVVRGFTYRIETPVGTAFVTINHNSKTQYPLEVFITVGKAGSDVAADAEAIGRLISLCLRISSHLTEKQVAELVVDQLEGIGGGSSIGFGKTRVRSLADGIAKVIKQHLMGETEEKTITPVGEQKNLYEGVDSSESLIGQKGAVKDICPKCGNASLIYEEGCSKCLVCGYSKC